MKEKQSPISPPSTQWQERGRTFIEDCQNILWTKENKALRWLHQQGLEDEIIMAARLGYNPENIYEPPGNWELMDKKIHLPRGIVIPNEDDENLWGIRFRLPAAASDVQKYLAVRGTVPALFGSVYLSSEKTAVLVESEFNALTIQQSVPDEVVAVATGLSSWCRKAKWVDLLKQAHLVLVSYDNDETGETASTWWLKELGSKAIRWRPWWQDANVMYRDGADLQVWLAPALTIPAQ